MIYVALDGDDVGDHIRRYFLENDEESVAQKSNEVVEITKKLSNYLENLNFKIVFCAGDDILSKGESIDIDDFSKFLIQFEDKCTFSVGIGETLERTYIALRYAKSIGKNKIVNYNSSGKLNVFALHQ
ncbi:MAG TPA: mCpol domain-containing protein [Ignavibacteria bacterium]